MEGIPLNRKKNKSLHFPTGVDTIELPGEAERPVGDFNMETEHSPSTD